MDLSKYTIIYQVTSIPNILYAQMTSAKEPLRFEEFPLSNEFKVIPIECRFLIFDEEGSLVEMSNTMVNSHTIVSSLNTIPLKMITKLVKSLKVN